MVDNTHYCPESGAQKLTRDDAQSFYENCETRFFWPVYSEEYAWWKSKSIMFKLVRDELNRLETSSFNVLDIGCAKGTDIFMMNALLKAYSVNYLGIDVAPVRVEFANLLRDMRAVQNCQFKVGSAEKLEVEDCSFDVVFCSEVLEHLPLPEICLKEIYRVLKPNGVAVVTTPNPRNLAKRFLSKTSLQKMEEEQKWCVQRHGSLASETGHVSEKSSKDWRKLSEKVGFKVETVKRGSVLYGGPFFDRHPALFGLILIFDSFADLFHTYGLSWDIILKLRKKAQF